MMRINKFESSLSFYHGDVYVAGFALTIISINNTTTAHTELIAEICRCGDFPEDEPRGKRSLVSGMVSLVDVMLGSGDRT